MSSSRPGEGASAAPAAVRFPRVPGRSLLGRDLRLPAELPALRTLAVVAFQQWQQARVDRWIARAVAAGVPATPRGLDVDAPVAVVELPVLGTRWRPARRFIDGGMAAGIRDPDVLARTITLYTDVGAFRRPLAIPGTDDVHALVVTRVGEVFARASGEPTDEGWAVLAEALGCGGG